MIFFFRYDFLALTPRYVLSVYYLIRSARVIGLGCYAREIQIPWTVVRSSCEELDGLSE